MKRDFVIWSIEHDAWWKPGSMDYTDILGEAGRYTLREAEDIVKRANIAAFHECLIPIAKLRGAWELTGEDIES